ncbi:phosphatidate cytidylyltransferase [Spirochaetia bacterium 38H-sp]|uniref:Phosphatidate cytidylyltransferase n=1 Tax=Rarispira pelagica TaxID=3141764 RepID=A0ABU9U9A5_9SPIR
MEKTYDLRSIEQEFLRKSIHMSIALSPTVANFIGVLPTIFLLGMGTIVYTVMEAMRVSGLNVGVVSAITSMVTREREKNGFVIAPITLGTGAMLALLLYPAPAATIAIYALAFGDGFASLVGKSIKTVKIPFTGGKSLGGSLACFFAVYFSAYPLLDDPYKAIIVAVSSTIIEMIPSKDLDNMIMPVGTGMIASLML